MRCASDDECLLGEVCQAATCAPAASPRPAILELVGPTEVREGEEAVFRYATAYANRIVFGAEGTPGRRLEAATGTVAVTVLAPGQTFVLAAESPSARVEAVREVKVSGGPLVAPEILAFGADPARLPAGGGSVRLSWVARGGEVGLRDGEGARVGDELALSGELEVEVVMSRRFVLEVEGEAETARQSVVVEVADAPPPPSVLGLSFFPAGPLARPRGTLVRVQTEGGEQVGLSNDEGEIARWPAAPMLSVAHLVRPEAGAHRYSVDVAGTPPASLARVLEVAEVPAAPTIEAFELDAEVFSNRGRTEVSARWRVEPSTALVRLWVNGGNETMVPAAASTTWDLDSRATARVELLAETPSGAASAERIVWATRSEAARNGRYQDAEAWDGRAVAGTLSFGDEDWFRIEARSGDALRAWLLGRCEFGLRLRVYDAMGQGLGEAVAPGGGACPVVEAADVAGGTYFVRLDDSNLDPYTEYTLAVDVSGPVCGDGRVAGNEACDDGGRTHGDGCDAQCADEPGWRYRVSLADAGEPPGPAPAALELRPYPDAEGGYAVVDLGGLRIPFFGEDHAGFEVHGAGFVSFEPTRDPSAVAAASISAFGDLALVPGPDALIGATVGASAVEVFFEGLLDDAGQRYAAVLRLGSSGEVRIRILEAPADARAFVGLSSPSRGRRRFTGPACEPACEVADLVGRTLRFEPG